METGPDPSNRGQDGLRASLISRTTGIWDTLPRVCRPAAVRWSAATLVHRGTWLQAQEQRQEMFCDAATTTCSHRATEGQKLIAYQRNQKI